MKNKKSCLTCKEKCPPAFVLIDRIDDEKWIASRALDFLYSICKEEREK